MVYPDEFHVTADTIDELYKYAYKLKVDSSAIVLMGRIIHPHFIIPEGVIKLVLADVDVRKVTCREIVRLCHVHFRLPETNNQLQEWKHLLRNPYQTYKLLQKPNMKEC
jgi:hypothetical protein